MEKEKAVRKRVSTFGKTIVAMAVLATTVIGVCAAGCRKTRLLTKIAFGVFSVSLLSLLAGCIYSARFALVKELSDSYLCIVNAPLSDKIAMVLGTMAIISFFVFLASMGGDVDDIVENKND